YLSCLIHFRPAPSLLGPLAPEGSPQRGSDRGGAGSGRRGRKASISQRTSSLTWYPTTRAWGSPFTNSTQVGSRSTSQTSWDRSGQSSTLSAATLRRPSCSSASAWSSGSIMWHGPHQSAQQSTRTGMSDFRTSASQFRSSTMVISTMPAGPFQVAPSHPGYPLPLRSPGGPQGIAPGPRWGATQPYESGS